MNERDYSTSNWNGHLVNWRDWNNYSPQMICRCAAKAKALGRTTFGIQFYGKYRFPVHYLMADICADVIDCRKIYEKSMCDSWDKFYIQECREAKQGSRLPSVTNLRGAQKALKYLVDESSSTASTSINVSF